MRLDKERRMGFEVKVEEVDVKLQALGLRGSRPAKKRYLFGLQTLKYRH